MDIGILLNELTRQVASDGRTIRHSIRDKFVLAALDKKDYPEPQHLRALIKKSIVSGIEKQKAKQERLLASEKDEEERGI